MYVLVGESCRSRARDQGLLYGKSAVSVLHSRWYRTRRDGLSDILWWNKPKCCRKCVPIRPLALLSVLGGLGFVVALIFFSLLSFGFVLFFKLLESTSGLVQNPEFWVQMGGGALVSCDCAISDRRDAADKSKAG